MSTRIRLRRGSKSEWAAANPVLSDGEIGVERALLGGRPKFKIGPGEWNSLPYADAASVIDAEIGLPALIDENLAERDINFTVTTVEGQPAVQPRLGPTNLGNPYLIPSAAWDSVAGKPPVVNEFDLWSFLLDGEEFPNDGVLDAAPLINRAIALLRAMVAIDTTGAIFALNLGLGRFRLNSSIDMIGNPGDNYVGKVERIMIKGAARWRTILLPYGPTSAFRSWNYPGVLPETPQSTFFFDNSHFEDFTVDARNMQAPEPGGYQKAFVGGGWRDCNLTRVNVVGTTATSFGTDNPVRCRYTDCHVVGSGRGYTLNVTKEQMWPEPFTEARSGFGIGFGHYDDESVTFVDCTAIGCLRSGFFFERQDGRGLLRREKQAIQMVGCKAEFCGNGVTDVGCVGVLATNCKFTDNIGAGWATGRNSNAVQGSLYGRISNCIFERNAIGFYLTGVYSNTVIPRFEPAAAGGGYVIENCRIQDNLGPGILGDKFELEAGGLTVRSNQFIRNGGYGMKLIGCTKPVRDLTVVDNDFDGNSKVGVALLVPMVGPTICDNRGFNSDGVQRQNDLIMFHPAELTTVPRVHRNSWRRHKRGLVNVARCDQTYVSGNREISDANDPATTGLYQGYLVGDSTPASTLGDGWTQVTFGTALQWQKDPDGARPSTTAPDGVLGMQVRNFGRNDLYVSAKLYPGGGANYLRGVVLAQSGSDAIVAGVDQSTPGWARNQYALWKVKAGVPTLLWGTEVAANQGHTVSLAREKDSTLTRMLIDDVVVHTRDIPDIATSNNAGLAGISGLSARRITQFRAIPVGNGVTLEPPEYVLVRNICTNPSMENSTGVSSRQGTGGLATGLRENDPAKAISGSYSYLLTWTQATTDPYDAGRRFAAIENPEIGKRYTGSIFVVSSVARRMRAEMRQNKINSGLGIVSGPWVDVQANVPTRLYATSAVITADDVSLVMSTVAASLTDGGTNFLVGHTLRHDCCMVTEGSTLYDYFDGDTAGASWVGTAHASASTKLVAV